MRRNTALAVAGAMGLASALSYSKLPGLVRDIEGYQVDDDFLPRYQLWSAATYGFAIPFVWSLSVGFISQGRMRRFELTYFPDVGDDSRLLPGGLGGLREGDPDRSSP